MSGETDLSKLLRDMQPELHPQAHAYAVSDRPIAGAFAQIVEPEGMTVIATLAVLAAHGVASDPTWARISLTVHSDLASVGLTAAIAQALAAQGISANVVAGFYHDHIFVQWERRYDAMAALRGLSGV